MSLLTILGIILVGVLLIIIEVIFIPGTTLVGILGTILIFYGLYISFTDLGAMYGVIISLCTVIIIASSIYYSIQKKVWKRYSLQTEIFGKVDNDKIKGLTIGQEGITISTLKPLGTAEFNNKRVEVSSLGGVFVEAKTRVRIINVKKGRVTIEKV